MRSLQQLWNNLAPWRRRRRDYFLRVVAILNHLHADPARPAGAAPDAYQVNMVRGAFNLPLSEFVAMLAGITNPPRYIEQLARTVYKLPPRSRSYVYGPIVVAIGVLLIASGVGYVLLH